MAEARDVGFPVAPTLVADGHLQDLHLQLGGREQQVEVSEGVQAAEVGALLADAQVVAAVEFLGPAQRVLEALPQQPRKDDGEEDVPQDVRIPPGNDVSGRTAPRAACAKPSSPTTRTSPCALC